MSIRAYSVIAFSISLSVVSRPALSNDDIFKKCSVNGPQGLTIPQARFRALADNLTDAEFAKFDPNCAGKTNNPQGVKKAAATKERQADRVVIDLKQAAAAKSPERIDPPLPTEAARSSFGKPEQLALPFLFRDAYSDYSLLSPPPPREQGNGTQLTYTRDQLNKNDVISGKGAVTFWKQFDVPPDSPLRRLGATRWLFAPALEFDQTRNRKDQSQDVDYISPRLVSELEVEAPNTAFPLQYIKFAGYWKTDSRGHSSIPGAYLEWQPYNLDYAIGVGYLIPGTPIQFRWAPTLHVEAERVVDAGLLTNVFTGDTYYRGGPIASADVFFTEGWLRPLVLNAQYRYFWNMTHNAMSKDIQYFQAGAVYNLDPSGVFAIGATFREGITPGNSAYVRDVKLGLTVKY